jgi:hypothetical protein
MRIYLHSCFKVVKLHVSLCVYKFNFIIFYNFILYTNWKKNKMNFVTVLAVSGLFIVVRKTYTIRQTLYVY